jgi:hypothetical protein
MLSSSITDLPEINIASKDRQQKEMLGFERAF